MVQSEQCLPLAGVKVVDLGGITSAPAARWLADLGADVVKPDLLPRPIADDHRSIWPGEASCYDDFNVAFRAGRTIKSGCDGDPGSDLLGDADILLTGARLEALQQVGLHFAHLHRTNHRLIQVSITPYGLSGPFASAPASDLSLVASSGSMYRNVFDARRPVRISSEFHSTYHACADAVVGALIALISREQTGRGELVDVSMQESLTFSNMKLALHASSLAPVPEPGRETSRSPLIWKLQDGYASFSLTRGRATGHFSNRFCDWMVERGFWDDRVPRVNWMDQAQTSGSGLSTTSMNVDDDYPLDDSEHRLLNESIARALASLTSDEVLPLAIDRRLLISPIHSVKQILSSPHFCDRDFWCHVRGTHGEDVMLPGPAITSVPPLATRSVASPKSTPKCTSTSLNGDLANLASLGSSDAGPLSNVYIADFAWVMAGASIGRVLADYGATVTKIEAPQRGDLARWMGPVHPQLTGYDSSVFFHDTNAGKQIELLDLSTEAGRVRAREHIARASVVIDSFSPGTMSKFGFDYQQLAAERPELVLHSASLLGARGPHTKIAGFGNAGGALSGSHYLTGWPDLPPAGVTGPYTDTIAPRFGVIAILAGLIRRSRFGIGAVIDQSQVESGIQFLAPEIVRYQTTRHLPERQANLDAAYAPNDVFPVRGRNAARRYIAISVATDQQWHGLLAALQLHDVALGDLTAHERHARAEEVYENIAKATTLFDGPELVAILHDAGVPASTVAGPEDLWHDPQLHYRGHFSRVPHAELGELVVESSRLVMSETTGRAKPLGATIMYNPDDESAVQ